MLHFDLPAHQTYATIYHGASIVGTIARPYDTRAHQNAVAYGAEWRITSPDGVLCYHSLFRPGKSTIARVLGLPRS